jgi:hypothetical protein
MIRLLLPRQEKRTFSNLKLLYATASLSMFGKWQNSKSSMCFSMLSTGLCIHEPDVVSHCSFSRRDKWRRTCQLMWVQDCQCVERRAIDSASWVRRSLQFDVSCASMSRRCYVPLPSSVPSSPLLVRCPMACLLRRHPLSLLLRAQDSCPSSC